MMATVPKSSSSLGISKNFYFTPGFYVFLTCKQLLFNCFRGKVVLTFEPLDCGQSNESSLTAPVFFNVFEKLSRENLLNDFDLNQFWQ